MAEGVLNPQHNHLLTWCVWVSLLSKIGEVRRKRLAPNVREKPRRPQRGGEGSSWLQHAKDMADSPHPVSQLFHVPNRLGQNPERLQAGKSVNARQR